MNAFAARFVLVFVSVVPCATAQLGVQWATFARDPFRVRNPDGSIALQVTADVEEKDYAWGDLDQDGWTDLVVVRKDPGFLPGAAVNQLLMNESGILVDRTSQHAVDSDIPGDMGFQTPTNDRDVHVADLDGDGWLDVVTVVTLAVGQPKHISHPRVYRNKGSVGGAWQGLRYEDARIPQLLVAGSGLPVEARFTSVAVGDVTGDGFPDLYFTDADDEETFDEQPPNDLNDRLLVNDGFGFFTDSGTTRMSAAMLLSTFGTASKILDMNGDGWNDVLRCAVVPGGPKITIAYQDPASIGTFASFQQPLGSGVPYYVTAGDLNSDGRPDLLVGDDGPDYSRYNTGNDASGLVAFGLPVEHQILTGSDDGFVGTSVLADLDGDGLADAIQADVDTTYLGCERRCHVYHNRSAAVGAQTALREEAQQAGTGGWKGVVGMQVGDLTGTFDVAVFDLDNDNDLDMVFGRCTGTFVWINQRIQPTVPTPYCFGDGTGTACPCGNASAAGDAEGCLHSLGTGGRLRGTGLASIAYDSLQLQGSRMPSSSLLYFQGDLRIAGGAGLVFGDGLRCATGSVKRLGTKTNVNGESAYPAGSEAPISVKGVVPPGATRHYQAWFRNAMSFCTAQTFNVTNGVSVTWAP